MVFVKMVLSFKTPVFRFYCASTRAAFGMLLGALVPSRPHYQHPRRVPTIRNHFLSVKELSLLKCENLRRQHIKTCG